MSYIHKCEGRRATTVERHSHCQPSETARLAAGVLWTNWLAIDWFSDLHLGGLAQLLHAVYREPVTPCHGTQGPYTSLFCDAASTVGQISLTVAACGEQMGMCARLGDAN